MGSLSDLLGHLGEFSLDLARDDELVWMDEASGTFSVKSLIDLASQSLGSSVGPPRAQMFLWCCAKWKFLTRMDLRRRGLLSLDGDVNCPLYNAADETIDHLLVTCPLPGNCGVLLSILWESHGSIPVLGIDCWNPGLFVDSGRGGNLLGFRSQRLLCGPYGRRRTLGS